MGFILYLWAISGFVKVGAFILGGSLAFIYIVMRIAAAERLTYALGTSTYSGKPNALVLKDAEERSVAIKKNKMWVFALVLCFIGVLVPSKRDVAIIYVVPKVVNSKVIQEDMPELYDIGMRALKHQLKNSAGISDPKEEKLK